MTAMTARSDVLFITDKTKLLKSALGQKRRSAVGRTRPVFPTTRTYLVPVGMSQMHNSRNRNGNVVSNWWLATVLIPRDAPPLVRCAVIDRAGSTKFDTSPQ